jgi:hypothetical protein
MFEKKKMQGAGMLFSHLAAGGEVRDDYEEEPMDKGALLRDVAADLLAGIEAKDTKRIAACLEALLAVDKVEDEAEEAHEA